MRQMKRDGWDPARMEIDPDSLRELVYSEDFLPVGRYNPEPEPDEYGQLYGMTVCMAQRKGIYLFSKEGPELRVPDPEPTPPPVRTPWVWGNV